jgi:hypothetical protein
MLGMEQMRRSYGRFGYTGLFDQLPGKRVIYRVPMSTVEKVLELYQTLYSGITPREFHKKPASEHDIHVNQSWLKQALQGALLSGILSTTGRAKVRNVWPAGVDNFQADRRRRLVERMVIRTRRSFSKWPGALETALIGGFGRACQCPSQGGRLSRAPMPRAK